MARVSKNSARSSRPPRVAVIAVVGGSGAGKSWLVGQLKRFFGRRACHVQLDDFYIDRATLPWGRHKYLNFDVPASIDWARAETFLAACRAGQRAVMPSYDFVTHRTTAHKTWRLRPIVLVEGLWLFRRRRLRPLLDLKIYLDVPEGLRCERRMTRDTSERGFTTERVNEVLKTQVLPLHKRFVAPQRRAADLILNQPYDDREIAALAAQLWRVTNRDPKRPEPPQVFRARLGRLLRPSSSLRK